MDYEMIDASPTQKHSSKFELITENGNSFIIDYAFIKESILLTDATNFDRQPSKENEPIKLELFQVSSSILPILIKFCDYFKDSPTYVPLSTIDAATNQPSKDEWEMKLLSKLSNDKLMEVLCAANYLNMPRLIDAGCYCLNLWCKGKTVDELRYFMNLPSDFTDEEEAQINRDLIVYSKLEPEPDHLDEADEDDDNLEYIEMDDDEEDE